MKKIITIIALCSITSATQTKYFDLTGTTIGKGPVVDARAQDTLTRDRQDPKLQAATALKKVLQKRVPKKDKEVLQEALEILEAMAMEGTEQPM